MSTPRSRLMAVLTLLAMLTLGVVIGVVADRKFTDRRPAQQGRGGGGWQRGGGGPFGMLSDPVDTAGRTRMRTRIVKRMTEELSLTPDQQAKVSAMFVRRELQLDSIRARVVPQLDSLRLQMRASMDSVLTPDQRVKYAEARRRMEERRRAGDQRDRPPGGDSSRRRD